MSSLFVDTHNMVANLEKSDAAEGFEQISDFLNGSYIHYALTVNPHIYVSCIKQFWNTASVKRSDDVTRLQALVDRKTIVISEDVIREILQLDDAEGVVCLPNEEIFVGLAQMGYKKPSTNWLFTRLSSPETVAEDVANEAIPSTPTPLILPSPTSHEIPSTSQKLEIIKLKASVKRLEKANKVKSSKLRRLKKVRTSQRIESSNAMEDVFNQGRMIDYLDKDEGIELIVDQVKDADTTETEGRHAATHVEKQAEIYHLDSDHPSKVLKEELSSKTPVETPKLKDKGKGILIETPKPMKKKDQIKLDAEYARKFHEEINKDHEEINKDIDWDATIDHVKQKSKENP
nr:hypothetical protein [Tanacetum cinerariifolium]